MRKPCLEKWQGFPTVTCMVNKLKFKSGQKKKPKKQNPIQILHVIRDKLFFKNLYFWPTCSMLFIRWHKIIIQPIDMLLNIYYMPRTVLANTKQWTKQNPCLHGMLSYGKGWRITLDKLQTSIQECWMPWVSGRTFQKEWIASAWSAHTGKYWEAWRRAEAIMAGVTKRRE